MAGGYVPQPQGIEALVAQFRKTDKELAILRKMITGFGLTVDPQGNLIYDGSGKNIIIKGGSNLDIQDDGSANVDGSMDVGGTLTVTGNALFQGSLAVPNGSIDNPALAHPITPQISYADNNGAAMPGTIGADLASGTLAIPAGFSQVATLCTITVGTTRSSSTPDGFAIQAWTEMQEDPANWYWVSSTVSTMCPGNGYTSFTISGVGLYSDIPSGWHLKYGAWVAANSSGGGWATSATNAHASLLALFFR